MGILTYMTLGYEFFGGTPVQLSSVFLRHRQEIGAIQVDHVPIVPRYKVLRPESGKVDQAPPPSYKSIFARDVHVLRGNFYDPATLNISRSDQLFSWGENLKEDGYLSAAGISIILGVHKIGTVIDTFGLKRGPIPKYILEQKYAFTLPASKSWNIKDVLKGITGYSWNNDKDEPSPDVKVIKSKILATMLEYCDFDDAFFGQKDRLLYDELFRLDDKQWEKLLSDPKFIHQRSLTEDEVKGVMSIVAAAPAGADGVSRLRIDFANRDVSVPISLSLRPGGGITLSFQTKSPVSVVRF